MPTGDGQRVRAAWFRKATFLPSVDSKVALLNSRDHYASRVIDTVTSSAAAVPPEKMPFNGGTSE